ncbi:MAG: GYD domain-containing protein [Candidatus Caldarchaeum sp.]
MPLFAMLTRVSPDAIGAAGDLVELEQRTVRQIETECPEVQWVASYAVLGPCDYLDIFQAPDAETAAKVSLLVRTLGHANTELWTLTEWPRFKALLQDLEKGID